MNRPEDDSTTPDLELAVVGLGNMGGAVLKAVLAASIIPADRIGVCDALEDRVAGFTEAGCRPIDPGVAGESPRVLLAVKPQVFPEIADSIGPGAAPRLAISVMAGLRSPRILELLGGDTRIVRTMPNTPAAIGAGVTAIAPGHEATEGDLAFARMIFNAVGTTVDVDESHLHAVTAVSGSGPAWVFRTAEAWIAAAVEAGLAPATAETLVVETMFGAAKLLRESELDAPALRVAVTSKGGTTAAGLAAMDRTGFDDSIQAAIQAAVERGHELDAPGGA